MARKLLRPGVYVLLFLLFTVLFAVMNLPQERIAGYVNAWMRENVGDLFTAEAVRVKPPLSLHISGINMRLGGGDLPLGDLVVTPGLRSLLSSRKSLSALLEGDWGQIPLSLKVDRDSWVLDTKGHGMDLSLSPAAGYLPLDLVGAMSADAHLEGTTGGQSRFSGEGSFLLTDVRLSSDMLDMIGVGKVSLSEVRLYWSAEDNLVTFRETKAVGDITGEMGGTILVYPGNPEASRVNLTLNLRPSPEATERFETVLSLLGSKRGPDGGVRVRVRGTLGEPKFSL